jgi:hypothetical protein
MFIMTEYISNEWIDVLLIAQQRGNCYTCSLQVVTHELTPKSANATQVPHNYYYYYFFHSIRKQTKVTLMCLFETSPRGVYKNQIWKPYIEHMRCCCLHIPPIILKILVINRIWAEQFLFIVNQLSHETWLNGSQSLFAHLIWGSYRCLDLQLFFACTSATQHPWVSFAIKANQRMLLVRQEAT